VVQIDVDVVHDAYVHVYDVDDHVDVDVHDDVVVHVDLIVIVVHFHFVNY
jgi:hypothetical protein